MKVTDTLAIEDKISQQMRLISASMEQAAASAKIAQNDLDALKQEQAQWRSTIEAATSSNVKNTESLDKAYQEYNRLEKEINKTQLTLSKHEKEVIKGELALKKLEGEQQKVAQSSQNLADSQNKVAQGFESTAGKIVTLSSAVQLFNQIVGAIKGAIAAMDRYIEAYKVQSEAEDKLSIITKQRMALNDEEVRSLYELASAQQKIGVVGDEVSLTAMAGLAAFTKQKGSIEALTPAMNNLAVKMYGYNVTAQSMEMISKSLGKAMQGDVGALSRMGIKIDDNTKKWLMNLNEQERAVQLAKLIHGVTGDLNEEFAKTPLGQVTQANNRLGDSMERLGQMMLPIKAIFVGTFANIAEFAVKNINTILIAIGLLTAGLIVWKFEAIATAVANVAAFFPVIAIIGAIVAAVALVTQVLKAFGVDTEKLAGQVIGAFAVVGGFIWNTFLALVEIALGTVNRIINPFIILSKFLARVFVDPVGAIKQLFVDMQHYALDSLNSIAKAIDKIFGSKLSASIEGWKKALPTASRMLDLTTDKLGRAEYNKAFKIMDNTNFKSKLAGTTGGADLSKFADGGALKTKQQGAIELKEEDIEALNELATRDFMTRFQTMAPSIRFDNVQVNENADFGQMLGQLDTWVAEKTDSSLEVAEGQ